MDTRIEAWNALLLERLGLFLGESARFITAEDVAELTGLGISEEEAVSMLLAAALGLDPADPEWRRRAPVMLRALDADAYRRDPYYAHVKIPDRRRGRWEFRRQAYAPYEIFVCGDMEETAEGRIIPRLGYFPGAFDYPAVLEDGREWMLITPNEIDTMAPAIARTRGKVLACGLGLGYFAYMAARRAEVDSVTVVERDGDVIALFREHILPQFPAPEKIRLVQADAFAYARRDMGREGYDTVFTDLWHDVSDGLPLYRAMKALEDRSPGSEFLYWIEPTLRCYLPREG